MELRETLSIVILACTAIATISGAMTIIARVVIRPVIRAEIDRHLAPNGHEGVLPARERGQTLRTLVLWSRSDIAEMKDCLAQGSKWMDQHEDDHRERDPSFPRRAHNVRGGA